MAYKNKEDQKAASKRYYTANKASYLARNKKYRRSIKQFAQQIKESSACADCGISYPYYVMDFDHLADKEREINFLASTGRIGALKREIEKCEIVCANCHRIRTHRRSLLD